MTRRTTKFLKLAGTIHFFKSKRVANHRVNEGESRPINLGTKIWQFLISVCLAVRVDKGGGEGTRIRVPPLY